MLEQERFFVVIDGKIQGPLTLQQLREIKVGPDTFVKTEAMADFQEIRELPDLSRFFSFEYSPAQPQYYAGLDLRLLAWAIDFFIVFMGVCIFWVLPVLLSSPAEQRLFYLLPGLLAVFPLLTLLQMFMEAGRYQASFGKILLKIRVSDLSGARISLGRSLLRNLAKTAGYFTLGLTFFIGFFSRKQQCLHDLLASTVVIKERLI